MTEKLTTIKLPGQSVWSGLSDWGEKSAEEMISGARQYSKRLREQADRIDAATDGEFEVFIHRGVRVRKDIRNIQHGKSK
jgi:hypothetical protein